MPKKKILILSSWYPSRSNPYLGNFVQRQASLLAEDHDVYVIHTCPEKEQTSHILETKITEGVKEIRIYFPIGANFYTRRANEKQALDMALSRIGTVDLLWTQIILPRGWQFYYVRRQFNCPWIHFESGSYFRKSYRKWKFTEKAMVKTCLRRIDKIFSVSEFHKKDLKPFFGDKPIGIIPNHIDSAIFTFKPKVKSNKIRFLHISTLDENTKNPKGIIKACQILKEKGFSNFELQIISDESFTEYQSFTSELELNDIVKFLGPIEWKELPNYYHEADAFILNSDYESFSIVLAEAWATGTPVISTPVGIAYNLDERLGLQSKMKDTVDLADQMQRFISEELSLDYNYMQEFALRFDKNKVKQELNHIVDEFIR